MTAHQTPRGRLYESPATEAAITAYDHITWAIRAGLTPSDAVSVPGPRYALDWDHAFEIIEGLAADMAAPKARRAA